MPLSTVLFLEDDIDLADSYREVLEVLLNKKVVLAHSLEELVSKRAQVFQCDIAFLDINLGVGRPNGLDAFEWLKKEKFQGLIYFLTGHAMSHPLVKRALEMGAREVLSKPMDIDEFFDMMEKKTNGI